MRDICHRQHDCRGIERLPDVAFKVIGDVPGIDSHHAPKRFRDPINAEQLRVFILRRRYPEKTSMLYLRVPDAGHRVLHFQLILSIDFPIYHKRKDIRQLADSKSPGSRSRCQPIRKKSRNHSVHHLGTIFTFEMSPVIVTLFRPGPIVGNSPVVSVSSSLTVTPPA